MLGPGDEVGEKVRDINTAKKEELYIRKGQNNEGEVQEWREEERVS